MAGNHPNVFRKVLHGVVHGGKTYGLVAVLAVSRLYDFIINPPTTIWFGQPWDSFLPPLAGSFLGVFGAFAITYIKIKQDALERERQLLIGLIHEVKINHTNAKGNLKTLNHEIEIQKEKKHSLDPLIPFQNEMWNLMKMNPPRFLSNEPVNEYIYMGAISFNINNCNVIIRNRESYTIQSSATGNFLEVLLKYDKILLDFFELLVSQLDDFGKKLEMHMITTRADEAGAYYEYKRGFPIQI